MAGRESLKFDRYKPLRTKRNVEPDRRSSPMSIWVGAEERQRSIIFPAVNPACYPKSILQVDEDSVRDGILHYFSVSGSSPAHHLLIAGVRAVISQGNQGGAVPMRKILDLSGYGFSTFYKYWPRSDNLFKDIWLFAVDCYMASELEHLRQLGRDSPSHFIHIWVSHAVLAQRSVPPSLFSMVTDKFFGSELLRMVGHVPAHIRNVLNLYVELFGEDPSRPRITEELCRSLTLAARIAGVYLFARNCGTDDSHSDEEIIDSIKKSFAAILLP